MRRVHVAVIGRRQPAGVLLDSVNLEPSAIEAIGAREGWRTRRFWRGPPARPLFELYEFWVENRVMLELATPEMLPNYTRLTNGPAQRAILAARP